MKTNLCKNAGIIFESYNLAVKKIYEDYFETTCKNQDLNSNFFEGEAFEALLERRTAKWEKSPVDDMNGMSPEEFFNDIKDIDALKEVFIAGAEKSRDRLPEVFIEQIKSFGEKAVEMLTGLGCDVEKLKNNQKGIVVPLTAIRTLGRIKAVGSIDALVGTVMKLDIEDEAALDVISVTLAQLGEEAAKKIIESLNEMNEIDFRGEFLLRSLTVIGLTFKSDEIYRCIKNTFLKMGNKVYGAACLNDYGDARAIPALRGYLERNLATISNEVFYEIKGAVEKLGGNVNDIKYKPLN